MNLWLLLPLLLPMLAGLLLLTKPFAEGKIRRLTVQIGLILTLVSLLPAFLTSGRDLTLFTLSDNVAIALHVDGISMCFCVLMAFVWTAAGFYSFDYMAHEGHEKRFYCLYLLTLGVLMGLCMSGSLVTFYMFYEAMTLLTMPLVMHSGSKEAVAAGIKYLIYSVVGASLVLLGIFAIAPYAQSLSFAPGGALGMAKVAGHEGFVLAIGGVICIRCTAGCRRRTRPRLPRRRRCCPASLRKRACWAFCASFTASSAHRICAERGCRRC